MYNIKNLSKRIKINEGYRNEAYKDKLGFLTIGYGHLIKKNEKHLLVGKKNKNFLNKLFLIDLNKAINDYKKNYKTNNLPKHLQELIIEMIFQLGIKKVLEFKKFNMHLKKNEIYLAAYEMLNSLWYKQTPKRVESHINRILYK